MAVYEKDWRDIKLKCSTMALFREESSFVLKESAGVSLEVHPQRGWSGCTLGGRLDPSSPF